MTPYVERLYADIIQGCITHGKLTKLESELLLDTFSAGSINFEKLAKKWNLKLPYDIGGLLLTDDRQFNMLAGILKVDPEDYDELIAVQLRYDKKKKRFIQDGIPSIYMIRSEENFANVVPSFIDSLEDNKYVTTEAGYTIEAGIEFFKILLRESGFWCTLRRFFTSKPMCDIIFKELEKRNYIVRRL